MDPNAVIAGLHRSREEMRAVLLAGQPGHEEADVFPRSRTMRFLLDPARRGIATSVVGTVASMLFTRVRRKRRRKALADKLLGMVGLRR